MSRRTFERDDPGEDELPLEEQVQRQFTEADVRESIEEMSETEIKTTLDLQFRGPLTPQENIAKLKSNGMWATARFYERLLEKIQRTT
jgi:hypothetical protein